MSDEEQEMLAKTLAGTRRGLRVGRLVSTPTARPTARPAVRRWRCPACQYHVIEARAIDQAVCRVCQIKTRIAEGTRL
jgi:hypothetical protein